MTRPVLGHCQSSEDLGGRPFAAINPRRASILARNASLGERRVRSVCAPTRSVASNILPRYVQQRPTVSFPSAYLDGVEAEAGALVLEDLAQPHGPVMLPKLAPQVLGVLAHLQHRPSCHDKSKVRIRIRMTLTGYWTRGSWRQSILSLPLGHRPRLSMNRLRRTALVTQVSIVCWRTWLCKWRQEKKSACK